MGTQDFFFVPYSWQDKKHLFQSYFYLHFNFLSKLLLFILFSLRSCGFFWTNTPKNKKIRQKKTIKFTTSKNYYSVPTRHVWNRELLSHLSIPSVIGRRSCLRSLIGRICITVVSLKLRYPADISRLIFLWIRRQQARINFQINVT